MSERTIPFPHMLKIRQRFNRERLDDPPRALAERNQSIRPAQRGETGRTYRCYIGEPGIHDIAVLTKTVVGRVEKRWREALCHTGDGIARRGDNGRSGGNA